MYEKRKLKSENFTMGLKYFHLKFPFLSNFAIDHYRTKDLLGHRRSEKLFTTQIFAKHRRHHSLGGWAISSLPTAREHLQYLFFQSKVWLNIVCIDLPCLWPLFSLEVKKIPGVRLGTRMSLIFHNIQAGFTVWGFIAVIETSEQKVVRNAIWIQLLLLLFVQSKKLFYFLIKNTAP